MTQLTSQSGRLPAEPCPAGYWNLRMPTLGGKQFWTDLVHLQQWRLQQHVLTGHCRLIDPAGVRHAWGNLAHCQQRLDQIRRDKPLPPVCGKVVILLHGLGRSRSSMNSIARYLRANGDYHVVNMGYASTRASLADHARGLDSVIRNLPEADEIYFVAQSLGNLVVRRYLANRPADRRIQRMVMLGPPNQGSQFARALGCVPLFGLVAGPSGRQLYRDWEQARAQLATPEFEFGIIAGGGNQDKWLNNRLIQGEDDLFVSVAETRLEGAHDFNVLPVWHSTLMTDGQVKSQMLRFLQQGFFVAPDRRRPIPERDPPP